MSFLPSLYKTAPLAAIASVAVLSLTPIPATAFTLTNGTADGNVTVGVDGYGSFGSDIAGTTDAVYNPVGPGVAAGTVYESGLAIRFGNADPRNFLSSGLIGNSGNLGSPTITGTPLSATSNFTFQNLNFSLVQTLSGLFDTSNLQTGTVLTQTYTITNASTTTSGFELVRYLDGDLFFNGNRADGGGRLVVAGQEILFETDSATGAADPTTFVGIAASGGTAGGFEINGFDGLRTRIINGVALANLIQDDGADADQFIDAGGGYDVTLALANQFSLSGGQSTTYTTTTIFGSGAPQSSAAIPEPTTMTGLALAGLGMAYGRRRKLARK